MSIAETRREQIYPVLTAAQIESIRRFPDMERFKAMIGEAGFIQAKAEPILGGLVAIHSGWKI